MTAAPAGGRPRVTLLTRANCHLCEPVRATVREVCAVTGDGWVDRNVDEDGELRAEYGDQVPVVLVDGEFLAAHHLDADTLTAALAE